MLSEWTKLLCCFLSTSYNSTCKNFRGTFLVKKKRKKEKKKNYISLHLSLSLFLFPQDFLGACDLSLPYLTSPQNISFQTQFQALIPEHLKPLFFYLSYRFINPDFLEMLLLEL